MTESVQDIPAAPTPFQRLNFKLYGAQESIPPAYVAGTAKRIVLLHGPPAYEAWRNPFLGIDSWAA